MREASSVMAAAAAAAESATASKKRKNWRQDRKRTTKQIHLLANLKNCLESAMEATGGADDDCTVGKRPLSN